MLTIEKLMQECTAMLLSGEATKDTILKDTNGNPLCYLVNKKECGIYIESVIDVDWDSIIYDMFSKAIVNGIDEQDVFLELVDMGFEIKYLSENCDYYEYVKTYMEEHGLL